MLEGRGGGREGDQRRNQRKREGNGGMEVEKTERGETGRKKNKTRVQEEGNR